MSVLAQTPLIGMAESASSVDVVAYTGYSIHLTNRQLRKRVQKVIAENCDVRANPMICTELCDFLFLKPERVMNRKAFDCWRWRNDIGDLKVCLHTDEATVV